MKHILVMLTATVLLTGCIDALDNRVEIERVGSNDYLINQKTGKAYLITETTLHELKVGTGSTKDGRVLSDSVTVENNRLEMSARVKLVGDAALYHLTLKPLIITQTSEDGTITTDRANFEWFAELVDKQPPTLNTIVLVLLDKDGFRLTEHSVDLTDKVVRSMDENNQVHAYRYEGRYTIPADLARIANTIDFNWRFNDGQ